MSILMRKCPNCKEKEIYYTTKREFERACKENSYCKKCSPLKRGTREKKYSRKCPQCGKDLFYTNIKSMRSREKRKSWCINCRMKEITNRPDVRAKISALKKIICKGEGNPFYGKHHTEETKNKIRNNTDRSYYHSKKFKKLMSKVTSGKNNGMYGKRVYDIWVEKYGKEEADKKLIILKKKQSINSSGKNNGMYGKPSPKGAGGGWSGWYKGWFFRSLRELSYMINVIEKKNHIWKSAEKGKIRINYIDYDGHNRTYRPDFILNNKLLIEIKPKKLMETPNNIRKKEAAIIFCKQNNLQYRMVDAKILDTKIIIDLYEKNIIKFSKKYKIRIKDIINKLSHNKYQRIGESHGN